MKKELYFKIKLILFFVAFLSINYSYGQNTIKGTVTDASDNQTLPGVNIVVKGTSIGTATDLDGNYKIQIPENGNVLVFSYMGYISMEIKIADKTEINIELAQDIKGLEEVVVVGYQTVKKKDLTGSVSTINPDEVSGMPVGSSDMLLQGRTSGVEVTQSSGAPGAAMRIRIRGVHSINSSNSPLVVIDGFPGGSLSDVNPNDIERIDVLKDASSLSIYGARATNGVILITTKAGVPGKGKIQFSYSKSVQEINNKMEVLGSQDYGYYLNEGLNNDGDPRPYPRIGSRAFPSRPEDIDWNVDWHNLVYRPGSIDEYQLSLSGGNNKTTYYISGNFYDQQGVIPNSDFKRYNARFNFKTEFTNWLIIGLNMNASRREFMGETGLWSGAGISNSILGYSPLYEPKDTLGNWQYNKLDIPKDNPLAVAEIPVPVSELKKDYFSPEFFALFKILPSLTFRTSVGFETTVRRHGRAWLQESIQGANKISPAGNAGQASFNNYQFFRFVNENVLAFDKTFNDNHHLMALGGYSWEKYNNESYSGNSYGFISDAFMFGYQNMGAADVYSNLRTGYSSNQMESYFGRINYDLTDRYSFTINGRVDGSSVFAKNSKYGFFPSGAFAWKAHNESFMKNASYISELKVRVSYGLVGNSSIAAYSSLARLAVTQGTQNNNTTVGVVIPISVSNDELSWESTKQFDIGLDIGLFNEAIRFTLDYYDKITFDLLFLQQFPATSGFKQGMVNIGQVGNKGFEFSVHSNNLKGAFRWKTDFNISTNRNEILKMVGADTTKTFVNNPSLETTLSLPLNLLQVGQPISSYFGLVYEGVYGPDDAESESQIGTAKYADTNGDGKFIAGDDRVLMGSAFPRYIWGMNNVFTYKGFELGVFVQASIGAKLYNLTRQRLETMNTSQNASLEAYNNRSRFDKESKEWTITDIPKISGYNKLLPTDRFIEDGSYIRLQNVIFGYSLPQSWLSKVYLSKLKIYVSGQNLLLHTKYKGYDPEVSLYKNSDASHGVDDGTYPNTTSFTFGVQMEL